MKQEVEFYSFSVSHEYHSASDAYTNPSNVRHLLNTIESSHLSRSCAVISVAICGDKSNWPFKTSPFIYVLNLKVV